MAMQFGPIEAAICAVRNYNPNVANDNGTVAAFESTPIPEHIPPSLEMVAGYLRLLVDELPPSHALGESILMIGHSLDSAAKLARHTS